MFRKVVGEMIVESARFGSIEVEEGHIIQFTRGMPGFEHIRRYILMSPGEQSPFRFLQSVDEPRLTFVVTSPLWFRPDYRVEICRDDLADLEIEDPADVLVLAVVTLNRDPAKVTANLLAPVLVNSKNCRAVQVVLNESSYSTRHTLKEELARAERIATPDEDPAADPVTVSGLRIV